MDAVSAPAIHATSGALEGLIQTNITNYVTLPTGKTAYAFKTYTVRNFCFLFLKIKRLKCKILVLRVYTLVMEYIHFIRTICTFRSILNTAELENDIYSVLQTIKCTLKAKMVKSNITAELSTLS